MDRFYYDLLNIGKKKMDEPKYTKLLNRIIDEETNYMRIENPTLDRVCKVVSTNINDRLKELNINSKIINTKELYDMYEHEFILSSFIDLDNNINYFIIDPSYSQFKNTNIEYTLNKTIEGKNLLWDNSNSKDGLKLLDSYNITTNSFKNNYPGGGSNWYAPSKETITYYIDPRNFLNEVNICFMAF